ncbi:MAG: N-acetyl sugar amidotransferase [Alphaproteobacteria bacterium]|nr:N-acetyl sugar amidotransferase [Alphaproteobacteria bacterium]
MRYCKRCLYPEVHPLFITFDEQGVCSGCRVHEEKDALDWDARFEQLLAIADNYRDRSGVHYDCIVPVTGCGDSFFIVDVVKNRLGLHPLLVSYNFHYNTPVGIRNLARLRTRFDVDHMQKTVDPEILKNVTRKTLIERASMYWHCLAGWYTYPVQMAVLMEIPLIIWGVNGWADQVGMFSHLDEVEMTEKARREHGLMNLEAGDLLMGEAALSQDDIRAFRYPSDAAIERVGVRGIYLGNYIRWDSKAQHERMIAEHGYETSEQQRTFNTYETVGCWHAAGLHDYIKFLKWGFGKVTDHACREIRLKRMTREEGIRHVRTYQSKPPEDLPLFLDWIGMSEDEFHGRIERFRNPRLWARSEHGAWDLKDSILDHENDEGVNEVRLEKTEECHFTVTEPEAEDLAEPNYIILGRGWIDEPSAVEANTVQ